MAGSPHPARPPARFVVIIWLTLAELRQFSVPCEAKLSVQLARIELDFAAHPRLRPGPRGGGRDGGERVCAENRNSRPASLRRWACWTVPWTSSTALTPPASRPLSR